MNKKLAGCAALFSLLLIGRPTAATTSKPDAQARAALVQLDHALKSRDVVLIGKLLTADCLIVMTNPAGGGEGTRIYSKSEYLEVLRLRFASASSLDDQQEISSVISLETGEICIVRKARGKSKVGMRTEAIESRDLIAFETTGAEMRIRPIVTELIKYTGDVGLDAK